MYLGAGNHDPAVKSFVFARGSHLTRKIPYRKVLVVVLNTDKVHLKK